MPPRLPWAATIAFLAEEFEEGLSVLDRAVALNPNRAMALSNAGWVRCYLGQAVDAIGDFERVIRLSPREITLFRVQAGLAFAHLLLEEFEEAVTWGRRRAREQPELHAVASGARRGSCPSRHVRRGESSRKAVAPAHTGLHDGYREKVVSPVRKAPAEPKRPSASRTAGVTSRRGFGGVIRHKVGNGGAGSRTLSRRRLLGGSCSN